MTVETFFKTFELFADTPDAIEKMRARSSLRNNWETCASAIRRCCDRSDDQLPRVSHARAAERTAAAFARSSLGKVEALMVLVEQLGAQLTASRSAAGKLMAAVVAEWTAGSQARDEVRSA